MSPEGWFPDVEFPIWYGNPYPVPEFLNRVFLVQHGIPYPGVSQGKEELGVAEDRQAQVSRGLLRTGAPGFAFCGVRRKNRHKCLGQAGAGAPLFTFFAGEFPIG